MWYVIPEVTYCVFVFIGPVFLTVLLVSSRHGWYHRSDHACVTWINSSRDISFLLVQILARDHGSLGRSVWSIDATISPILSKGWSSETTLWVPFSWLPQDKSHQKWHSSPLWYEARVRLYLCYYFVCVLHILFCIILRLCEELCMKVFLLGLGVIGANPYWVVMKYIFNTHGHTFLTHSFKNLHSTLIWYIQTLKKQGNCRYNDV